MILIIDIGIGNTGSIYNMIKRIGFTATCSAKSNDLINAKKIILPGIGSFDYAMKKLMNYKMTNIISKKSMQEGTPILGICLGMQILCKKSEEGLLPGIGIIDAEVKKFQSIDNLKIPHMGWNSVTLKRKNKLFHEMPENLRFYFVHSYYVECNHSDDILTTTLYGKNFVSSLNKNNVYGVQFHPEKSHKYGMQLLKNFISEI